MKPRKKLSPEKTRALRGSGAVDPMTPEDLQKQNLDHGSPERRQKMIEILGSKGAFDSINNQK